MRDAFGRGKVALGKTQQYVVLFASSYVLSIIIGGVSALPTGLLTCICCSLAMLHTHVTAYLRQSPSPSCVSLTAACRPPPFVAAARVSAFAVRLQSVMTAKRLQSTSGQDASRMIDLEHPASAMDT